MNTASSRPAPPGTLRLVLPDFRPIDTVAQRSEPFALWPIGPRPLLAWWLDEAVRRNVATVQLLVRADVDQIRTFIEKSEYWSRRIEIIEEGFDGSAAESVTTMPGAAPTQPPQDGPGLLRLWLELHSRWLHLPRDPNSPSIDREIAPGVWVAPHARISATARLHGPCWIGESAVIEDGCVIGPDVAIGASAVIDGEAEIDHSVVQPQTYVGRALRLHEVVADASTLLDARRGVSVAIPDRFLLAPLQSTGLSPFARCAARWIPRFFAPSRRGAIA